MRIAFKEWAIVVDALTCGEQIIILRKGGISEGRGGFKPEHQEFLLFPTLFHQQREAVIAPAKTRYDQIAPGLPPREVLRIDSFAQVCAIEKVESPELLGQLRPFHIWRDEVIAERFDWSKQKHIYCLFVRTWKLPAPVEVPMLESYGGCKSWVEIETEIETSGASASLGDQEFERKLQAIKQALASHPAK